MTTEKLQIITVKTTLTDGSDVFKIVLGDAESKQGLAFDMITEASAIAFIDSFKRLIDDHTLVSDIWVEG